MTGPFRSVDVVVALGLSLTVHLPGEVSPPF